MKKTIYAIVLAVMAVSCQNKDLFDPNDDRLDIKVRINWEDGLTIPYDNGVRVNLFSLTSGVADYGRADMPWNGGAVQLRPEASYITYVYSYVGNNVQFRNETDPLLIEATSPGQSRATYSRTYPSESTISSISGDMHLGVNPLYTVLWTSETQYIDVYPENIVVTYTYEVRGITGAQFISSARGGVSGFSASHFLASGTLSANPSTILFENAKVDAKAGTITGSFRTFGRLDCENNFTIEILFPSSTPGSGIIQQTWDVTSQIDNGTNFHIVIHNLGLEIPDEGGEDAGGWEVDLNDWNDVSVPLN